jgi:hypothetical protein
MRKMMVIGAFLLILCSCSSEIDITAYANREPVIFPDYKGVTVPCNIAPMDFEVISDEEWALKIEAGDKVRYLSADNGLFTFGRRFWKKLLEENRGSSMTFTLCFRGEDGWNACNPFEINVAPEEIDPYLVYRLIPPGYSLWNEMGIYQRDLTSFDENAIYRNTQGRGNCVNCHSFRDRDPEDMLFHMRSELAGTYIFRDGVKEKLDTKTEETISPLVYPYWHTTGRYVAFSVNKTNQTLHVKDRNQIEVFDEASDVVVYDVENHEIVTADLLSGDSWFETFPTFSPDGRSLYFCTSPAAGPMPDRFKEARYSLCRVDFNPQDCSFGTKVDTLYNALIDGGSVSFPRISPDGKMLVFALSGYGNFSIWHKDSDLYSVNLETGDVSCMNPINSDDVESYHSWSSDSRWLAFSSRRDDGLYTKPYFAYVDSDGNAHKPFLLPQRNPKKYYDSQMYAYNIPELVSGKVEFKGSEIADFARNEKAVKLKYNLK